MADFIPWDRYPALTLDRLVLVANAIRKGRRSAVADHQPSKGDDAWTLGCVAYKRSCFELGELREDYKWLTIVPEDQNRFTFAISGIPLKFYKGQADDPPSKSLAISYSELHHIQLSLDYGTVPDATHILRVAVETDVTGLDKAVALVELDESGANTGIFFIPDIAGVIVPMIPKPVDPGPAGFTPIQTEEEAVDKRKKTGTEGHAG